MDEQIMRIVGASAMVKVHAGEVVTWALIEVRNIISQHSQSAQRAQIKKWQPSNKPGAIKSGTFVWSATGITIAIFVLGKAIAKSSFE